MCLTFNERPELKRAGKDIPVFKCIKRGGGGVYKSLYIKGVLEKWTQGFHYSEPYFKKSALIKDWVGDYMVQGDALHSCATRQAAMRHSNSGRKIVEMYIPKGAYYYMEDDNYVSSALVYPKTD